MLELTEEQSLAVENGGQPPRLVDPRTKKAYVLVAAETYDRVHSILSDDANLTMPEVARLVDDAMREEDAGDPTLAYYQETYGKKR